MSQWCREQVGIDLEGARKHAAVSATRSETEKKSEEELDREPNRIAGGCKGESLGEIGSSGVEWGGAEDY